MPAWLGPAVLAMLSIALLSAGLDRHSLLFDDGYSLWFSSGPGTLVREVHGTGGNMALYYVLLWLWRLGGSADAWLRLFSVLWAVAGTVLTVRLLARLTTRRLAWASGLWLATNPLLVELALEVRGYTLVYFLGALLVHSLLRYLDGERDGWLHVAIGVAVAAVATHYLAIVLVFALGAWAAVEYRLDRRRERLRLLVSVALAALLGVLYITLMSADGDGSLSFLTNWRLLIVPHYLYALNGHGLLYPLFAFAALTGCLLLLLTLRVLRGGPDPALSLQRLLVLWIALPFLAFALVSELLQPIYKARYLVWLLPAFAALIPALAGRGRGEPRWLVLVLAMCASNLVAVGGFYERESDEDWRAAAALLERESDDGGEIPLLFYIYDGRFAFDAYAHRVPGLEERLRYPEFRSPETTRDDQRVPEPDWRALEGIAREHAVLWLITTHVRPERPPALQRAIDRLVGDRADRGTWKERPRELARILGILDDTHSTSASWSLPGVTLQRFERGTRVGASEADGPALHESAARFPPANVGRGDDEARGTGRRARGHPKGRYRSRRGRWTVTTFERVSSQPLSSPAWRRSCR